ncbi:MAG TPA: hypothetical protein VK081_07055 [Planctomycetota bacterium]|nr:hypothetical protein [Planctomycetota bacterium]
MTSREEAVATTPPPSIREDSDVFRRLPPDAQARVRAAWEAEAAAEVRWHEQRRRQRRRTVGECTALLLFLMLLVRGLAYGSFALTAFVVGPLVGLLVDRAPRERFVVACCGMAGHAGIALLTGLCSADVFGIVLTGVVFAIYGVRREFGAFDGDH